MKRRGLPKSCHPAHRRRHWLCAEAGVSVDRDTARRLFTLIYALLMRNADLTDLGRRPQASSDETIGETYRPRHARYAPCYRSGEAAN